MRRPCISLQPGLKGEDLLIVSKKKIIPTGYTVEDCDKLVWNMALPSSREEALIRSANFTTDGKATDRVVNLVYSLLE